MRFRHRILAAILTMLALNTTSFAHAQTPPKVVLLEDPALNRTHYPLLISNERGYRIRCRNQAEEESIIRGLGFLSGPSESLNPTDPLITASAPLANPLLCPYGEDYQIKLYAHDSGGGSTYYLWFPTGFDSDVYKDRLYIPGCIGLLNSLGLKTSQAVHTDPTVFFSEDKIHTIGCLSGDPIQDEPATFAQWCTKTNRTDAETATVSAVLDVTPAGSSGINNSAACKQANTFLNSLPALYLNGKGIRSLAPLAELTNLTSLSLRNNAIKDISPLLNFKALTFLDLSENEISSTAALAPLTALTTLNLSDNNIQKIGPLSSLTALMTLDLGRNKVNDLWPLTFFPLLTRLSLAGNGLTGNMLEPLIALSSLTSLDLSQNNIEKFEQLADFPSTLELNLSGNPILDSNAQSFEGMCFLHRETASPYADTIRKLIEMTGRTTCKDAAEVLASSTSLDLSGKGISDVAPIALLSHLTHLKLAENQISDISPLADFSGPLRVELDGNPILDADKLSFVERCVLNRDDPDPSPYGYTMQKLLEVTQKSSCREASEVLLISTSLDLSGKGVSDAAPIALLPQLTHLNLSANQLIDTKPIAGLTGLIHLNLAGNEIEDISHLAGLTKLVELYLEENKVKDIMPVTSLVQLNKFNAVGNPVNVDDYLPACLMRRYHEDTILKNYLSEDHVTEIDVLYEAGGGQSCFHSTKRLAELKRLTSDDPNDLDFYDHFVNKGLRTVDYFKVLKNIDYLDLWNNRLTDLSALQSLPKLTDLYLGRNPITSLNAVKSLTQLKYLSLRYTLLDSLEGINLLTNLNGIDIFNSKINELLPLLQVELPLRVEMYDYHDDSSLEDGSITLNLKYESFMEYCLVRVFDEWRLYTPRRSSATPTKFRAVMDAIETLMEADHVDVSDPRAMDEWAKKQESLKLTDKNITSIEPLRFFKKLRKLDLSKNKISDLSPLANLSNLEELRLWGNKVQDINPLKKITNLKRLSLSENNISFTDLSLFVNLSNIEMLDLSGNNFGSYGIKRFLRGSNVKFLHLNNTNLESLAPVGRGELPQLKALHVSSNNISTWHCEAVNKANDFVGELTMKGNPICNWQRPANMSAARWKHCEQARERINCRCCPPGGQ